LRPSVYARKGAVATEGLLLELGRWGREYRGDFVAAAVAFLITFLITWAINGLNDVVALTSLFGLLAILTLLLLGSDRVDAVLVRRWRKDKFRSPKIGILNGYLSIDEAGTVPTRRFTDYEPRDWYEAISSLVETRAEWLSAEQISEKFDVILNPFGETYPETNKPNLTTLRKIVEFVMEGGIFVNVAGLAFYYLWDGAKEDVTGPLYETYQIIPKTGLLQRKVFPRTTHLLDSSLYRHFGIRTTFFGPANLPVHPVPDRYFEGLADIGGSTVVNEFRSAYRSDRDKALLMPLLKAEHKIQDPWKREIAFECYPLAAVRFGRGYLILSGMKLERERPEDFEKVVESIKCVVKKLSKEGVL